MGEPPEPSGRESAGSCCSPGLLTVEIFGVLVASFGLEHICERKQLWLQPEGGETGGGGKRSPALVAVSLGVFLTELAKKSQQLRARDPMSEEASDGSSSSQPAVNLSQHLHEPPNTQRGRHAGASQSNLPQQTLAHNEHLENDHLGFWSLF